MRSSLRLRLGAKLGLAFAGVLAVMLASLAVVLLKSAEASHAYERAIAWRSAVEGAAGQAAGTRQQQAAQALYVATGEERYKREWHAGVNAAEKAGAAVAALHDPVVGKLAAGATEADRKHDAAVTTKLFPAMERGDMVAAGAALALADQYVRIPLQAQEKIGAHVRERETADVAAAKSAAAAARTAGIVAGLLASLLAAAIVFLVSRGIRRSVAQVLDRLSALERNDATALQDRWTRSPTATSRVRSRPTPRRSRPPAPTRSATSPAPPTTSAPACTRPSTPTTACVTAWPG